MTSSATATGPAPPGFASDVAEVRHRYRWIAPIYPAFDYILALPPRARERAVDSLGVAAGMRVLEVGCGTGRNLPPLSRAVGGPGRVYGVDVTPEMLEIARRRCASERLSNVVLVGADAGSLELSEPVDRVLFSLSYSVLPDRLRVLRHVWGLLRPGGSVVILDGRIPDGPLGRLMRPFAVLTSRGTVLGDPDRRPWEDLRELSADVSTESLATGIYYVCRAVK
jgi:ubiquinone/menaquinone biosynthesis C-methylase UbiE